MKSRLFSVGILSLLGLAACTTDAQAGIFHFFGCHRCHTHITCRPYNAFTPFCFGNFVCDGCCPTPYPGPCGGGFNGGGYGACGYGGGYGSCGVGAYGGGSQFIQGDQGSPVVLPANPNYVPMPSAPVNNLNPVGPQSQLLQPTGYNPYYNMQPGYPQQAYPQQAYPQQAYPQQGYQMPYYWGYGR